QAARHVGDGGAGTHRPLPGSAGHRHQAAHALRDLVEARAVAVGPVLAEAGNARENDSRVYFAERVIVDAEAKFHVRAVVLHHHIRSLHQPLEHRARRGQLEVQRHRALVAVQVLHVRIVALAGCAGMRDKMPAWMPGSGAMKVSLTGAEEVPAANTEAKGSGSFRVAEDGTISGSVTTEGVQGTMAHIHQGAKGANGPVIVPLTKNGDTYTVPAGAKLNAAQMSALKSGGLYVNVHSAANKGGEIRAQLNP